MRLVDFELNPRGSSFHELPKNEIHLFYFHFHNTYPIQNFLYDIRSSVPLFAYVCVLYTPGLFDLARRPHQLDWQINLMSPNITRHQHHKQIHFDYSLHQTLKNFQSAKYLGITITDNMYWGQHISEISSKATKTFGFLRRNLAFATRDTKEVAYKTLVRP